MRTLRPWILLALVGCGGGYGTGDFGATPGGVKDLTFARALIAKGVIPPADALLVEAMFAEHDLPLEGAPCARTLCLRGAAGFAPEVGGEPRGWAQVGMSSTIDPTTWERPSTTFVFTVDVSGSMGWGSHETPGDLSRRLMHELTDQLRPDDRVAIVTFGSSVDTVLDLTAGTDKSSIHDAINGLGEDGSTDMESGLKRAYAVGVSARKAAQQTRVVLFTDTQPNVGATTPSAFENLVAGAANKDVHTTVMAFGTGVGPSVLRAMASLRGANAFSMMNGDDVDQLMADSYPWFTTPIAYDLRINVALDQAWSIDRGLGFPAASDAQEVGLKASTVFLSKNKGALLVALQPPATTPESPVGLSGRFTLAYTEPSGFAVEDAAPFGANPATLDGRGQWFEQHGVARTTALGLLIEQMHEAAGAYATSPENATQLVRAAHDRFAADASVLGDADLAIETDLSAALLGLMEQRAQQGTLYGSY